MDKVERPKKFMFENFPARNNKQKKAWNEVCDKWEAYHKYVMQPIDEVCELIKDHNKKKVYGLDDYKVIKSLQRVMWNAIKESKRRREEG